MELTIPQLTTLKTEITTNPLYATAISQGNDTAVVALLNAPDDSNHWVWRTSVTETEYVGSAGVDVANADAPTAWSWTGAGFITRSQGERDAWNRLFLSGSCNPSLANVRQAFLDILSGGTAPAPTNRNHMSVLSKRKATRLEKLFATGVGTFASPATLVVEGAATESNVVKTRGV